MVKGQTTSYYAIGGGLNKYQLVGVDIGFTPLAVRWPPPTTEVGVLLLPC
ncbi:MAG: hypothetical protein WBF29_16565 [Syntrophobacteria bacterium]